MQDRIKVAVRVRPPFESEVNEENHFESIVAVTDNVPRVTILDPRKDSFRSFYYDTVFGPSVSQELVYKSVGLPIVRDVMSGINGTIMAYGQTGSGKTHTMGMLNVVDDEQMGLVPRCLSDVFYHLLQEEKKRGQEEEFTWSCNLSFLQIYMEMIQDLLCPSSTNLKIQETREGANIPLLTSIEVKNGKQAASLVMEGLKNRSMAPTLMNITSSRAHTVLALEITKRYQGRTITSKLRLVDLAGSERVNRTQSSGARLNEAKQINKSLSVLGNVISGLIKRPGGGEHIPYRDSKLTRLLKDVLRGNSNITLIATLSPTKPSYYETMSTLVFAQRCMKVQTSARINEKFDAIDYKSLAQQLQNQIMVLQKQPDQTIEGRNIRETERQSIILQHNSPKNSQEDIAWSLVDALYETLWEVYEMSLYSVNESRDRTEQIEKNWHDMMESERISSITLSEELGLIHQLYPPNIVQYDSCRCPSGNTMEKEPIKKTPVSDSGNLEQFVQNVASIHRNCLSNILCLSKNLEVRDRQMDDVKRNLLFSGHSKVKFKAGPPRTSQSNVEIAIYLQSAATKIQRLYRRYKSRRTTTASCSVPVLQTTLLNGMTTTPPPPTDDESITDVSISSDDTLSDCDHSFGDESSMTQLDRFAIQRKP